MLNDGAFVLTRQAAMTGVSMQLTRVSKINGFRLETIHGWAILPFANMHFFTRRVCKDACIKIYHSL